MQAVTIGHQVLQHGGAFVPFGLAGEHLGVQVELGQQEPGGAHADMTGLDGAFAGQVIAADDVLQFFLQPGEEVGPLDLDGRLAHHVVFRGERHVSEAVDRMVIGDGAEKPGFIPVTEFQALVGGDEVHFADELVGGTHLHEDAGIERIDEGVVRRPVHIVEVLDGLVVPAADTLVGRQFLVMVQTADVLGGATVQTGDGSTAVRAVIAGGGEAQIDAGDIGIQGGLGGEHLVRSVGVGVDRRYIQVTHARSHRRSGGKDSNKIVDGFHFRNAF